LAAGVRRLLSALLAVAAFIGAGVGAHFGWQALCESSRLQIRGIDVVGNVRARPPELSAYAGLGLGDSILRADLDAAALSLRRHPWVSEARVYRRLPDRVTMELSEHSARLLVSMGDIYVANAEGHLFKRLAAGDQLVLPVVTGIEADENDEAAAVAQQVRDAIHLADGLEADGAILGHLEELHWDTDLGWSVVTRPERSRHPIRFHLGRQPEERIAMAARALRRLAKLRIEPAVIWADGNKRPGRVHVQLRAADGGELESDGNQETLIAKAR
jgi:cell division protein FtsQ